MRTVICILALLCIIHVAKQDVQDPSDYLERLVNLQKKATEGVLNGLVLFEKKIKGNMEVKVNDIKADTLLNINNIVTEALENVNLAIEKGKKDGKNVDECHAHAKVNLETKSKNANAELETCVKNVETTMEIPLENVKKNIEAANALMGDLDAIMPNCYSPSIIKMQTCVLKNLYTSRASLARLDNNAKDVMKTALFAYTTAISDARSCTTKLLANTRTFSVDITVRTSSCVRNAPPANGTTSTTASTTSSTTSSTTASV